MGTACFDQFVLSPSWAEYSVMSFTHGPAWEFGVMLYFQILALLVNVWLPVSENYVFYLGISWPHSAMLFEQSRHIRWRHGWPKSGRLYLGCTNFWPTYIAIWVIFWIVMFSFLQQPHKMNVKNIYQRVFAVRLIMCCCFSSSGLVEGLVRWVRERWYPWRMNWPAPLRRGVVWTLLYRSWCARSQGSLRPPPGTSFRSHNPRIFPRTRPRSQMTTWTRSSQKMTNKMMSHWRILAGGGGWVHGQPRVGPVRIYSSWMLMGMVLPSVPNSGWSRNYWNWRSWSGRGFRQTRTQRQMH